MRVVGRVERASGDGWEQTRWVDQVRGVDEPGLGRHAAPLEGRAAVGGRGVVVLVALKATRRDDAGHVGTVRSGPQKVQDHVQVGVRRVDSAIVDADLDSGSGKPLVIGKTPDQH